MKLGRTDLHISEIGFGGIPIIPMPTDEAAAIVRYCFDQGITFFDSANMYATSEEKIGIALAGVRQQVVLATKTTERQAAGASAHIDQSLKQLKTDWIDLYQFHNVSNHEALAQLQPPGGAYEAAAKAQQAGKIRSIGLSSHSIPIAMAALKTGLFETLQFPFNFIESDPEEALFPLARDLNVGIIGMKPLGGGLLERADICFGFLQQHPDVIPIPGMRTRAEVDEIVGLYLNRQPLLDEHMKKMEEIRSALGEKFCHRCEYCMPCEQGVRISGPPLISRLLSSVTQSFDGQGEETVSNLEFGLTMIVVGMGGTLCVLSLFAVLMSLLKKVFPPKGEKT